MSRPADVLIAGLGAMGSAAAWQLARRGKRVIGFDRFRPPHDRGSSHGESRIIREAYAEHPAYVPLVQRAFELWKELEHSAGRPLLRHTGGLMIGEPEGVLIRGVRRSAELHHLRHEVLSAVEVSRRFPAFRLDPEMVGVWEPRAGVLFPEACIEAQLTQAATAGADLHFEEPVLGWDARGDGVVLRTTRAEYRAARLLITAGAWANALLPGAQLPLTVERQVLHWFLPLDAGRFRPECCPIYLWEPTPQQCFYGFPDLGHGVKIARHHSGSPAQPDTLDREVTPAEIADMRTLVERYLPLAAGVHRASAVCPYTNTPDQHFWIDWHPAAPAVLIASPCSGHGFKFASAIGETVADLLTGREPRCDLSLFRARRG